MDFEIFEKELLSILEQAYLSGIQFSDEMLQLLHTEYGFVEYLES